VIKKVKNYREYYITSDGKVISTKRGSRKYLKPWPANGGHLQIELYHKGVPKRHYIHQLVLAHFVGRKPSSEHVSRHMDDFPPNNRLENLQWAPADVNHGDRRGKPNAATTLADGQVRQIIELGKETDGEKEPGWCNRRMLSMREIAQIFGVSIRYVSNILKGRSRRKVAPFPSGAAIIFRVPFVPKQY
jgi:hypothetical protein